MAKTGLVQRRGETPADHFAYPDAEPCYIHEHSWRQEARRFDIIIWPLPRTPWEADEAVEKIFLMEKILKKKVYPSFDQILLFENRAFQHHQLKAFGLPVVSAFNSFDYEEAVEFLKKAAYPLYFYKDWGKKPWTYECLKSYRSARKRAESAFRLGVPGAHPGHRSKQGVFFLKAPAPERLQKKCYGIDGKIFIEGHDCSFSDGNKDMMKRIFDIPGFRDFEARLCFFPKEGEIVIEAVSPFLADFSRRPVRDREESEEGRSIHSELMKIVAKRLFQETT